MIAFELKKKKDFNTSNWSGGSTTELYIYPENSSYKDREFLFRISTAEVSLEHSCFTSLPGYSRYIMPLKGEMELKHKGHHHIKLNLFEQDYFQGSWDTESKGKCTDFNLMLKEGLNGGIDVIKEEAIRIKLSNEFTGFYLQKSAKVRVFKSDEEIYSKHLDANDFFILKLQLPNNEYAIEFLSDTNDKAPISVMAYVNTDWR